VLNLALHIAIDILEWIGAFIIVSAAAAAVFTLTLSVYRRQFKNAIEPARLQLAQRLVLALEFLIAADILASIHTPTLEGLGLLGAIIAMRTVLSLSITYELRHSNPFRASAVSNSSPERNGDGDAPKKRNT
jgi:uncharacterized membrane protein